MKNRNSQKKVIGIILIITGLVLSWGGMFYALDNVNTIKYPGIIAAVIGYCLIPAAFQIYITANED